MERLLDPSFASGDEYIALLDKTIELVHKPRDMNAFQKASAVLTRMKDDPNSWRRVAFILQKSKLAHTRFFALQVLELTVNTRWKTLPKREREDIKNYLVGKIINLAANESSLQQHRMLVTKMNNTLVHVLKHEWPQNWPGFIPDIITSSKRGESLCENNVHILKLLSEEVFDFSKDQMTSSKTLALKEQLKIEFERIFGLLRMILSRSKKQSLILITLKTLQRFITWVPLKYIFTSDLVKSLLTKFFPVPVFRNDTLACLTEIAGLKNPEIQSVHANAIRGLFVVTITRLAKIVPVSTDIAGAVERGSENDRNFVRGLSLFCTTILANHLTMFEGDQRPTNTVSCRETLLQALMYIVRISEVEDKEIFKICVEFWHSITKQLYEQLCGSSKRFSVMGGFGNGHDLTSSSQRARLYAETFSRVRLVMITKMAKPEEVLIEQDDRGEIVRQATKDTDAIALYKTMRETIVYLTHLDNDNTEQIMLDKLDKQVNGSEWSWNNLNRLCWAIGSISMTMSEDSEKRFLVTVIKDLLGLCERKRGKDNKAVIASNIMYVVGQYPRFLRAHWRFLKTVVNKLFEFMHELHPGVQDMACDTFLKISKKCRQKFVETQSQEREPYISELLRGLGSIISELQAHQVLVFYEAVGYMIGSEKREDVRKRLLFQAMSIPDQKWKTLMQHAGANVESLKSHESIKLVSQVLRTNIAMCKSLGHSFIPYLGTTYKDMLNVYKVYSDHVKAAVQRSGNAALRDPTVRLMRVAKREVLQLVELFIEKSSAKHAQFTADNFLPPLLEPVLKDYNEAIPIARDAGVLSLLATMVNKLKGHMNRHMPIVMKMVFQVTFGMLSSNFEDFPEIRLNFFTLVKAIVTHCFASIFAIDNSMRMAFITSIVGAMKHTERVVAEMGLDILFKFLEHVQTNDAVAQMFYKSFFMNLLREVLAILTDRLHKSGFPKQAVILKYMFSLVESGKISVPLTTGSNDNKQVVMMFVMQTLSQMFPHMSKPEIRKFVSGSFNLALTLAQFKRHLHDFLVHTKEWSVEDNSAMFVAEQQNALEQRRKSEMLQKRAIPGLLNPHELDDLDDI